MENRRGHVQVWNVESYKIAELIVRNAMLLLNSGAEKPDETCQNQHNRRNELEWICASNEAATVPNVRKNWRPPKYVIVAAAIVFLAVISVAAALAIEDRRDEAIAAEILDRSLICGNSVHRLPLSKTSASRV